MPLMTMVDVIVENSVLNEAFAGDESAKVYLRRKLHGLELYTHALAVDGSIEHYRDREGHLSIAVGETTVSIEQLEELGIIKSIALNCDPYITN